MRHLRHNATFESNACRVAHQLTTDAHARLLNPALSQTNVTSDATFFATFATFAPTLATPMTCIRRAPTRRPHVRHLPNRPRRRFLKRLPYRRIIRIREVRPLHHHHVNHALGRVDPRLRPKCAAVPERAPRQHRGNPLRLPHHAHAQAPPIARRKPRLDLARL